MGIVRVSPAEARSLVEEHGYVYVDVRSVPEFEAGHPDGAYNIPFLHATAAGMAPNPRFVAQMRRAFGEDAKVVLGCKAGVRSLGAAEALQAAGFANLRDQRAGFDGARDGFGAVVEAGWRKAGLPVSSRARPGRSFAELAGEED